MDDLAQLQADPFTRRDSLLIAAFIEDLEGLPDAVWSLLKWPNEWADDPRFASEGVTCLQHLGYNIYRIKPRIKALAKYRILYAYDSAYEDFYLLAIVIRKTNQPPPATLASLEYSYEPDEDISQRVMRDYDELQLPRVH